MLCLRIFCQTTPAGTTPKYNRAACQLHLQAAVDTPGDKEAIAKFLSGEASSSSDGGGTGTGSASLPRLFVWVPRRSASGSGDDDGLASAHASTDVLDGNNMGAVAFVNTAATAVASTAGGGGGDSGSSESDAPAVAEAQQNQNAVRSSTQLQCMTLCPRIYEEEGGKGGADESAEGGEEQKEGGGSSDEGAASSSSGPGSATFLSLQMYARHCFFPAIQAIEALESREDGTGEEKEGSTSATEVTSEDTLVAAARGQHSAKKKSRVLEGLEDKIRELDVALGQCRRSALGQIPHVTLKAHPAIAAAAASIPSSGKMDMAELGLAGRMDDDAFLNEVQAGVSAWIGYVRSLSFQAPLHSLQVTMKKPRPTQTLKKFPSGQSWRLHSRTFAGNCPSRRSF